MMSDESWSRARSNASMRRGETRGSKSRARRVKVEGALERQPAARGNAGVKVKDAVSQGRGRARTPACGEGKRGGQSRGRGESRSRARSNANMRRGEMRGSRLRTWRVKVEGALERQPAGTTHAGVTVECKPATLRGEIPDAPSDATETNAVRNKSIYNGTQS